MTKKSKIDPKKRKNGDNFFKMSSIIIIKNIKLIDFYLVFWLNFMTMHSDLFFEEKIIYLNGFVKN